MRSSDPQSLQKTPSIGITDSCPRVYTSIASRRSREKIFARQLPVGPLHHLRFARGAQSIEDPLKRPVERGNGQAHQVEQGIGPEHHDHRIPQRAQLEEPGRHAGFRFFHKGLDAARRQGRRRVLVIGKDVPVFRFRAGRLRSQESDLFGSPFHDLVRVPDMGSKQSFLQDEVVRGENRDRGLWISFVEMHEGQQDAGPGFPVGRLDNHGSGRPAPDLPAHLAMAQVVPGDDR